MRLPKSLLFTAVVMVAALITALTGPAIRAGDAIRSARRTHEKQTDRHSPSRASAVAHASANVKASYAQPPGLGSRHSTTYTAASTSAAPVARVETSERARPDNHRTRTELNRTASEGNNQPVAATLQGLPLRC